ncbi:MAG: hypothetical protein LBG27_03465 [Spirochaetaceae bacterium]|jgi:hypothetical protein|nr:hypothetical protein [Spirochaetaceae bacterium]
MAKLTYGEDELRQTRARLDVKDEKDAKFMMKVLGGEVGEVRAKKPEAQVKNGWNRPYAKQTPTHRVETAGVAEDEDALLDTAQPFAVRELDYRERVKMDVHEAKVEFKIKTWTQTLRSKLAFFKTPPDVVNRFFVTSKMDDYFLPLKKLVNKVRLILPRNNTVRNKKLKQEFPFAFSVLDVIRYWDVEKISSLLSRLQSRPRSVVVSDFKGIIKAFYRPLFILEFLEPEIHLVKAVKDLDCILQNEADTKTNKKTQDEIVMLFNEVNEDTRYRLYPLLMKFVSPVYLPYGAFFSECKEEIRAFLGITPEEIVLPVNPADAANAHTAGNGHAEEDSGEDAPSGLPHTGNGESQVLTQDKPNAVQRGLGVLEQLFPEAGWDRLDTFPDIYHYFAKPFSLKRNEDIIDPENPVLQALILMHILEELFYGFRFISFNETDFDLTEFFEIIDEWHKLIEGGLDRMYLPRLAEFAKLFYTPLEPKQKVYAMKIREELNWTARLFLFPLLKIDMFSQAFVHKKDITPAFPKIRTLRQDFTIIAGEIEKAMQAGGASAHASCAAINNPWDKYIFQVENPLSKRLNALLGKEHRTNVSLIYYTLSVLSVLDYFLNSADSWAYKTNTAKLFRSSDAAGFVPVPPPEKAVDADMIFKRSIEKLKARETSKKQNGFSERITL